MSSESDGTGKADNFEVIRKLLQKLEEAATVDGKRPTPGSASADRADAELTRSAPPRAKPPVLEAKPLVVAEQEPGRELSSLQRGMVPARVEPAPVARAPGIELSVAKPADANLAVRSRSRSPAVALAAFALGAVSAAGLVTLLEPFKLLHGAPPQTATGPVQGEGAQSDKGGAGDLKQTASAPTAVAAGAAVDAAGSAAPQSTASATLPGGPERVTPAGESAAVAAPQEKTSVPDRKDEGKVAALAPGAAAPAAVPPAAVPPAAVPVTPATGASSPAPSAATKAAPQGASSPASPEPRSAAGGPGPVALSVAPRIEGRPGSRQAFPLKLEPMPREDQHLLVVLRGMPEWASMSKGSVIDTELWLLPAHAADALEIELSANAKGSADVRVELATLDGKLLARAPTALVVSQTASHVPQAIVELKSPPLDQQSILHLLARGDLLLDTGDFDAAREVYKVAAEAGSAGAALKLGQTYDPAEVDRLGMTRKVADEAMARRWYELARSLGSTLANDRLSTMGRQ